MKKITKALFLLFPAGIFIHCQTEARLPNIILIVVDDMEWSDLGCYRNDFHETPNIDRQAGSGIRYINASGSSSYCREFYGLLKNWQEQSRAIMPEANPVWENEDQ